MANYCSRCGAANDEDASFCYACGVTLTPPDPENATNQQDPAAHTQPPTPAPATAPATEKKKVKIWIPITTTTIAVVLALAFCGLFFFTDMFKSGDDDGTTVGGMASTSPSTSPTPESTPPSTSTPESIPSETSAPESPPPETSAPENTPAPPEEPTPPPPPWGPLTAEFLALLDTRNYYIKSESVPGGSIGSDGDITPKPDPLLDERARQDDAYAIAYSDIDYDEYWGYKIMHHVIKDNKFYSISHSLKRILVDDNVDMDSEVASFEAFPVSSMEFIESGTGSVNGVSMPYEDYDVAWKNTIIRFYIDGANVAHSVRIQEGKVTFVMMNIEISQNIPSDIFGLPADYTVEEVAPPGSSGIPPEKPAPQG